MGSFLGLFSVFLVLQPWSFVSSSNGNFLAPIFSPIFDDACKEVECGKGTCKPSNNTTIPFECECSPGWKHVAGSDDDDDDDDNLKFLPCVIPNCTFDYSCSQSPSPVQEKENQRNGSIFNVCRWADCGGGRCNATSLFQHRCECNEGYYNLFNSTFFPCLKECSIGMDCKGLGIAMTNRSTSSPPPSLSENGSNRANFNLEGGVNWLMITFALLIIIMAK